MVFQENALFCFCLTLFWTKDVEIIAPKFLQGNYFLNVPKLKRPHRVTTIVQSLFRFWKKYLVYNSTYVTEKEACIKLKTLHSKIFKFTRPQAGTGSATGLATMQLISLIEVNTRIDFQWLWLNKIVWCWKQEGFECLRFTCMEWTQLIFK